MDKEIELDDFEKLIPSLRGVLEEHKIDKEQHHSIISSMLFNFSYFLDQHQESYLHEEISCYVDDNEELISGDLNEIYMLGELQIVFGNKRRFTTNITNVELINKSSLVAKLVGVLRLEDIGEDLNKKEIQDKFISLVLNKREGIHSIRLKNIDDIETDTWREYNCKELSYVCNNINEVADNVLQISKRFFDFS